jgi:toxin ParE1/3/4
MATSSYRLTRSARGDLSEIHEYIARDKPETAKRYLSILRDQCRLLADNPGLGLQGEEYLGLYKFPVGNYLIFYRPVSDGIQVIRVLHGSRDIERELRKP